MKNVLLTGMLLIIMMACQKSEEKMESTGKVIELVLYKSKANVSESEATKAAKSVNDFISQQPGFISRSMYQTKDSLRVDLVYWQSISEAKAANQKAMQAAETKSFFSTIDQESIQFMHAEEMFTFTAD